MVKRKRYGIIGGVMSIQQVREVSIGYLHVNKKRDEMIG